MPDPISPQRPPSRKSTFREVAKIRDREEGVVVAAITERESDGKISFCIFREFDRTGPDGDLEASRSTYMALRHIPAIHRLLIELVQRLEEIEERSRGARRIAAGM